MIFFKNVTKAFGRYTVLDDLNLHIEKGKITFIIGKSGEGKSVTIKHIMGLMCPDQGSIVVGGVDITKLSVPELRQYRQKIGMLFQHAALFDSLTVGENVCFPLKEQGLLEGYKLYERVEQVLERSGLPHIQHKYPHELSTGEKKRVGLARALVAHPDFILYDEPTTGMDPLICEMIDNLIVDVNRQEGITSVVISHDLKAALATADNIIMLYKGKVALTGSPDEFKSTEHPIVRQFFSGRVDGPIEFF